MSVPAALTVHAEVPGLASGDVSDQPRIPGSLLGRGDGLFSRVGRSEDHTSFTTAMMMSVPIEPMVRARKGSGSIDANG